MRYAHKEYPHSKSFADALVVDQLFRSWVLKQTKFAEFSDNARLLHREMLEKRTSGTEQWWNSHFNPLCSCYGCKGGKETDLLAVFETPTGMRFALHVEVKNPDDKIGDGQAAAYTTRAKCWVNKTPARVLPHSASATILLFSELRRRKYAEDISEFETLITLEEVAKNVPDASGMGK